MQGAHLICTVNSAKHFFSKLSDQSKILVTAMTHMTVLSEVYTCAFIKTLSSEKHEWQFGTISVVHSKQYKTAREGQMFSAQSKVIKIWEREMFCPCACTNTPSLPSLHAPLTTNTVFEARTEFQVGNPGREHTIPSKTEKSSYLVNAFTGFML